MTPAEYHRVLLALDVVLDAFEGPAIALSPDDARMRHELRVIRSQVLKAESGHPFPFQRAEPAASSPESPEQTTRPPNFGEVGEARRSRIRTLVVDDQESVRTVVRLLLEAEKDIEVV